MRVLKGITRLPLLVFSLSFLVGIVFASLLTLNTWIWLLIAGCIVLIGWGLRGAIRWAAVRADVKSTFSLSKVLIESNLSARLVMIALVGLFLGGARYQSAQPVFTESDAAWYNDQAVPLELTGVIIRPPDVRETHVQAVIAAEQIEVDWETAVVEGRVLVYLPSNQTWAYGDRVRVWGILQTPPVDEDFSYRDYLARQGIYSYIPYSSAEKIDSGNASRLLARLYAFKQTGLDLIYAYLPDPEASLLAGIVLGVESGIPDAVDQAFKDTGTTHIIAISGFNITIVAGLFSILFGRLLGPRRGAYTALLAISLYTVLVGADAAVVRAAIMGGLSLFARQVGRRQHGYNSLGITAAVMAIFNPLILWDIGFQLSFAATLGLIVYAQSWEEALNGWMTTRYSADTARRLTGPISEYLLLTLAAQLVTFPLIVYHFGRLSLSSLPANVAILPAQPPVMVLGGLAVLFGAIWHPLGQILAYAVWPFLAYTIRMVEWFSGWGAGVQVVGGFSVWMLIGFYLLLFAVTIFWQPLLERLRIRLKPVMVISVLLVSSFLIWQAVMSAPDGKLHVIFLDVGNGEAVLIESPDGRFVLIGGGESATRLSDGLGRSFPLFHRKLDVLAVAGTRKDQLQALPAVVPRYRPQQVWWSGDVASSSAASQLHNWVVLQEIILEQMAVGQVLDLGQGAEIIVLQTSQQGAVLLVRWEDFRVLLPIGAAEDCLSSPDVLRFSRDLTAVLLANSGDLERNPAVFLNLAHPQMVLVSVDTYNRSGHPDAELLSILEGYPLYRTDYHGSIELETDGQQMWVHVENE